MYVYLVLLLSLVKTAPVPFDHEVDVFALKRLKYLGYLKSVDTSETSSLLTNGDVIAKAIQQFQRLAYISETGVIDAATRKALLAPRCGVSDFTTSTERNRREKRFAPQGTKWNNNPVTWRLENSNNDGLTDNDVRFYVRKSLQKWSDAANIDFVETPTAPIGASQIRVLFATGTHQDDFPFDGPSGTLAHAFFPLSNQGLSGDIHFDDDEVYTFQDTLSNGGTIKFLWVAVHELGHSLGLAHSDIKGSIMYPFYFHFPGTDFNLTPDDVAGIQAIYGQRTTTTIPTATQVTSKTDATPRTFPGETKTSTTPVTLATKIVPSLCPTKAKAMLLWNDDKTYVFNDDVYYVIGTDGYGVESSGYVSDMFTDLKNVDAVHRRQIDNFIVLFHGDSFSVFDNLRRRRSFPRKIYNGYLGLPVDFNNIDDAMVYPKNNKLYVFKGDKYWRFSQLQSGDYLLDFNYPMNIFERWIGVPDNIDAVFTWRNQKTYFVKDDLYYRFDDRAISVSKGYPLSLSTNFLACNSSMSQLKASASSKLAKNKNVISLLVFASLSLFS